MVLTTADLCLNLNRLLKKSPKPDKNLAGRIVLLSCSHAVLKSDKSKTSIVYCIFFQFLNNHYNDWS